MPEARSALREALEEMLRQRKKQDEPRNTSKALQKLIQGAVETGNQRLELAERARAVRDFIERYPDAAKVVQMIDDLYESMKDND